MPAWRAIVARVRARHPQLVMSGENYGSWDDVLRSDANMGGQGFGRYHEAMQAAVRDGDASGLESVASSSGADAATVVCYLHPSLDGRQPGACPTMYFRDMTATMSDVRQYRLWVALEAGSGIVSQHDYDPNSSCAGWDGCEYWSHGAPGAWWNVTNDPHRDGETSPLWAFTRHRALNRIALRTKLRILAHSANAGATDGGALAYLKHDSMGPRGDACVLVYNPGVAQHVTIDLSALPISLLTGRTVPYDLFAAADDHHARLTPPLAARWTIWMGAGEARAYGGFRLGVFAPRAGKRRACVPDDAYSRVSTNHTLQTCFLECLHDARCANVLVEHARVLWMRPPPQLTCTILGAIAEPGDACTHGTATLVTKLVHGRPNPDGTIPANAATTVAPTSTLAPAPPRAALSYPPPALPPAQQAVSGEPSAALQAYRTRVLLNGTTYDMSSVEPVSGLPTLTADNRASYPEWHAYITTVYGTDVPLPLDLNTLSWFYWDAPLRPSKLLLADWNDP